MPAGALGRLCTEGTPGRDLREPSDLAWRSDGGGGGHEASRWREKMNGRKWKPWKWQDTLRLEACVLEASLWLRYGEQIGQE